MPDRWALCTSAASGTRPSKPVISNSIAHMAAVRQHRKTTQPFHAPRNTQKLLHSSISATKQPAAPHTTMRTRSVHGPRGSRGSKT